VKLRQGLEFYLVAVHLLVAIVIAALMWQNHRTWILLLEAAVLVSALVGWRLVRAVRMPDELVRIGSEWMKEGDFSQSVRPAGTTDLRELVELFNGLFSRLRDERTRLREQNLFLDKVMSASPSGMITTDPALKIDFVNPAAAALLDRTISSLLGVQVEQALPEAAAIKIGERWIESRGGGRRLRWSRAQFFDRSFPRHFFLIEDLTHELWTTEKQSYHRLIRTLSHEVNNTLGATGSILRSVLAYEQQLTQSDREDFTSALQVAAERGDNLVAFVKRYAEVVRVPPPAKQPVDFPVMLRQMVRLFEVECADRSIDMRVSVPTDLYLANIDSVQMEQVLVNVLRNAIEAVDRNGTISIRLQHNNDGATLRIEDSGPGLDPETRAGLFTPFFSTKAEGQGIGLTLVREILTAHGFAFDLESVPDGLTCFWIQFGPR
jgi:two-component system nitrogen regulation sensor histidine kinase NtrY